VFTKTYKRYVLSTLTLAYTLSALDQGLIILLLQPIKEDLHLSDTQLGFLTGIAFGLLYSVLGLPIARWADRSNRTTITSIVIALWGGAVVFTFFVTTYVQLVFGRMAAALGGSGCMPVTFSLLGDYCPTEAERTRAMSIYMLANPLSLLVSFALGGWLSERYGWRVAFLLAGAPALLVAGLVKLTITEPRASPNPSAVPGQHPLRLADLLRTLWYQGSTRHLVIGLLLIYTFGVGMAPWYAAFLMRSHHMGTAELGVWLGLIFGLGGIAGVLFGGYAAHRWFAQDERGQMRLVAVALASQMPLFALFCLLPEKLYALIALIPMVVVGSIFFGPVFALMQRLVADETRATTVAVVMLLCNLIGMGIGPQVVGILSDLLKPALGSDSLRYAMLVMSFLALWGAYHFWRVGQNVREDLSTVARRIQRESI
jgi:predicted MFS family arabinose efflux permease